jgi:hypothetical protein
MISFNLEPIIQNKESFHYYLKNYNHVDASSLNVTWEKDYSDNRHSNRLL